MVARLVVDELWRNRWVYAALGPCLLVLWLPFVITGLDYLSIRMPVFSLIFAAMLGPITGLATMGLRELRQLPITSGELWRATWVTATIVPTAYLLTTKLISVLLVIAFGGSPKAPVEAMLLSAVYDFAWTGMLLPLFVLPGHLGHALARSGILGASLASGGWLALAGSIAVLSASVGLPLLAGDSMPARIDAFTQTSTGVLTACLAVAFAALAWTPPRAALIRNRLMPPPPVGLAGSATRIRLMDRLTGLSRVAIPYLLMTLALAAGACFAMALYGVTTGSGAWWFVPERNDLFDPADVGDRGLTYVVLMPVVVVTLLALWTPWARSLKVLPLSVRQINALLIVTPLATWAVLWLVGLTIWSLAYGMPSTLRLDLPFGLAGTGALAHACLLRFQGGAAAFWVAIFIANLASQAMKVGVSDGTAAHVVFAVMGAIAFCTAAFINHRTLTRSTSSSRAYQQPQPPFGLPKPAGFR